MGFPQLFVALPWFTVDGYSFKQSVSWQPGVLGISSSTPGTSELPILWNSEIIKYQPLYTRIDTLSWWLVPLLFPFNLSLGNAVPFMFIPCHENPKKIAYITVSPINQGIIIPFYGYIMLYIYSIQSKFWCTYGFIMISYDRWIWSLIIGQPIAVTTEYNALSQLSLAMDQNYATMLFSLRKVILVICLVELHLPWHFRIPHFFWDKPKIQCCWLYYI